MIKIQEYLRTYRPPLNYAKHIDSIVSQLPRQVTKDLGLILLRDTASLSRTEQRIKLREGKAPADARGLYYRPDSGRPARIELYLDNILGEWPSWITKVPLLRYEIVGRVFFHELGHHVYALEHPRSPRNEEVASSLGSAFLADYCRVRYRSLMPLVRLAKLVVAAIVSIRRALMMKRDE